MKDLLLNAENDLDIQNGDFVIGESTEQHIGLIIFSEKGDWRQFPWLGASVRSLINDEDGVRAFKKELKKQLEMDGADVVKIEVLGSMIEALANY